jgi:spore germination protein D
MPHKAACRQTYFACSGTREVTGVRAVRSLWPMAAALVLAAGCGGGQMGAEAGGTTGQQDYTTVKQMVVDILHSPDGKKALQETFNDPNFKSQVIVSDTDIRNAVEKSLESKKNQSFLAQQAKDPQFAQALANAVQPQLIQIQKQLMKDPAYQKDLLVLFKSPEFTKNLQDLMQTPEFRGQIMKIMTEALQTPSFRMQFQDALKSAVAEQMQTAGTQQQQQQKGGNSTGGGGGGGGDGGSGGDGS